MEDDNDLNRELDDLLQSLNYLNTDNPDKPPTLKTLLAQRLWEHKTLLTQTLWKHEQRISLLDAQVKHLVGQIAKLEAWQLERG